MIKITAPRLANKLNEMSDLLEVLNEKDNELTEISFSNQSVESVKRERLIIYGCLFSNCIFTDSHFRKAQLNDVVFKNCDLSNIHLSGSSFTRVEFNGCKLTGTNLSETQLNHVLFRECRGEYINLSGSNQRNVFYQRCNLRGGAFDNCVIHEVGFETCNLVEAEFYQTALKGVDLSDSEIAGIRVSTVVSPELRGVTVNTLQALELANLLGVKIRE
ncbi:pentapeptide repeat-containing protein [Parabacteroides sp. PF5-9]|uniref:pentapeptide repeat-containing protein n=1 Tax=Parabacteroides sp. PF5-9 TaxID=1742404 RepID=UPI0024735A4F|nr:pentapeptide repeat-containing protein [Parabacteroides sp. PF5-9]MDH6358217.1 uncharacterized protein YjbI with pentapeptide repeats [Parabacteroides sp. PF5-9]